MGTSSLLFAQEVCCVPVLVSTSILAVYTFCAAIEKPRAARLLLSQSRALAPQTVESILGRVVRIFDAVGWSMTHSQWLLGLGTR